MISMWRMSYHLSRFLSIALFFEVGLSSGFSGALEAGEVKLTDWQWPESDGVTIRWTGSASKHYPVEVSPGLPLPFIPITGLIDGSEQVYFTDPAIDLARRFYRVAVDWWIVHRAGRT